MIRAVLGWGFVLLAALSVVLTFAFNSMIGAVVFILIFIEHFLLKGFITNKLIGDE